MSYFIFAAIGLNLLLFIMLGLMSSPCEKEQATVDATATAADGT
jgi:hypothetical protein